MLAQQIFMPCVQRRPDKRGKKPSPGSISLILCKQCVVDWPVVGMRHPRRIPSQHWCMDITCPLAWGICPAGFVECGSALLQVYPACAFSMPSSPSPSCTCSTGILWLCMDPVPGDSKSARAFCFNRHGKLMLRNDRNKGHGQNASLLLPLFSSYHPFCRSFWIASF